VAPPGTQCTESGTRKNDGTLRRRAAIFANVWAVASRSPIERLKHHLLASLGVSPALLLGACSGEPPSADEAGVTTNPSSGSTIDDGNDDAEGTSDGGSGVPPNPTTSTSTGTPTSADSGDGDPDSGDGDPGDGDGDPDKLDVAQEPDLPPLGDCTVTLTDASALDEHPECPIVLDDGVCWSSLYWGCTELEPGQTCARACVDGNCIADWTNCAGDTVYEIPSEFCGPYEIDGQCCTLAKIYEGCGSDGRPFVIAGVARQARLHANTSNRERSPALSEALRERLAAHWAAVARAEHASIASFAQFGARLLALGAPPTLVRAALAAADDEVRHAELALARASQYAQTALEFGALDTSGAGNPRESLADTVLACVREGCIGETLAALELETLADACDDPELAASLRAIADDEARHAALAWQFVQWALAREPGLAKRVAALFESLAGPEAQPEPLDAHERELLRAHGCLPADERRQLERAGLRELVQPCAHAL
jgi:hypothetical protein